MKKILFVVAMQTEADPMLEALGIPGPAAPLEPPLPPKIYTKPPDPSMGLQLALVVNGEDPIYKVDSFGSDAATLATYLGIKNFSPDLVISAGVAGGFLSKGAYVGYVYVSRDTVRYFDRRVSIRVPNYHDYALGYYPVVNAAEMVMRLGLEAGIVVTGESFENSPTDNEMIALNDGAAIEMEAAAVAKMSMLLGVPFMAVKAIVDVEEETSIADQFNTDFKVATTNLALQLKRIVAYLSRNGWEPYEP